MASCVPSRTLKAHGYTGTTRRRYPGWDGSGSARGCFHCCAAVSWLGTCYCTDLVGSPLLDLGESLLGGLFISRYRFSGVRWEDRRISRSDKKGSCYRNRPGRNRTCNPRFWSPLLAAPALQRLLIFNDLAFAQQRRRRSTTPALALILALRRTRPARCPPTPGVDTGRGSSYHPTPEDTMTPLMSWVSMARRIRARRSHLRRQQHDLCARVVRGLFRTLSIDAQDRERFCPGPARRVQEHCPSRNRKPSG